MAFFKVATACILLAATAMAAPQFSTFEPILDSSLTSSSFSSSEDVQSPLFDDNPQYTYSYQVAADDQQTYIAQSESRDGANVQGEYSYVDPLGDLIKVVYTAGPDGYQETRTVEKGFVQIRARPVTEVKDVVQQVVQTQTGKTDSDLVAKIISQLTPFIKNTVSSSLN